VRRAVAEAAGGERYIDGASETNSMAEAHVPSSPHAGDADTFSPVDNEPPLRWQRALHLAPAGGLGVGRRAVFFALVSWLPIALWALLSGRFVEAATGEPLLQHYGVHARCLLVIPLLILGEASLHKAALFYTPQFIRNGLVDPAARPRLEAALRAVRRWRDASLPWVFVLGGAVAWTIADRPMADADAMSWALDEGGALGFGGFWFAYVVRPIFIALLLGWIWRIVLLTVLFVKLGRLGLSLVPTHPDRAGGLGFLEKIPAAFAPVTFALSAMLASRWAHEIVHHGQTLQSLKAPAAAFVVVWTLLLLAPLFALMPALRAAKRAALPAYSALVAKQGRLVRRQWIDGEADAESPMIEPAGVGPIADAATMYDAVRSMRSLPVGRAALAGILGPIVVPMLVVASLQIPARDLLLKLLKTLL
jgi:hypothetical protein